MFIIIREVYPPTILCIDSTLKWMTVDEGQRSNITLFWDWQCANATLVTIKQYHPDAKVVGVHVLERLVTLKQIGDRIKREPPPFEALRGQQ